MKNLRILIIVLAVSVLSTVNLFAQHSLKGKVIDNETKEGLIGASIQIAGTEIGTATNVQSEFEVKSKVAFDLIIVSYTGYETKKVAVSGDFIIIALEPTAIELDQTIVTASRDQQDRKDASVSMNKIQKAELKEINANFHSQVLSRVASIHIADFGNEQMSISIREPLSFSRSHVVILEDGIPIGPTALTSGGDINNINLHGIGAVEVLRGPNSSLYGSEAIGGTINYLLSSPTLVPTAGFTLIGNDLGYKKVGFNASNTFKKFGIAASGYWAQRRNGYRQHSDMDKLTFTLKAEYLFSYKTKLTAALTYFDFTTDFAGSLDSAEFYTDDSYNQHTFAYVNSKGLRSYIRLDHYWNENSKTFFTAFVRNFNEEEVPTYRIRAIAYYPTTKYAGEFVDEQYNSVGLIAQHKQKLKFLNSSLIGGISSNYTPELYYSEVIDVTEENGVYTDYKMTGPEIQDFNAVLLSSAAYLHYEITPIEKMKVLAALRYDRLDYIYDNHLDPNDISGARDTTDAFQHLSPKIGLTYDLGKNRGFYANYSIGFAPPSFNQLYKTTKVPVLKPSTYYNYEFGGWYSFAKKKGSVDISLYRADGKNEIVEVYEGGASTLKSVGETRHSGVEYTFKYKFLKDFNFRFSGSNSIHEYISFDEGAHDYSGNEMSIAPHFIANSSLTYKPLKNKLKGLWISAEWQYISEYYMNEDNSEKYGGYNFGNARLGYTFKSASIWFNVLNVTDELFAARASKSYYGNPTNPIIVRSYSPGIHRTLELGISYNFTGKKKQTK
ncbi:MAG: TonB-dependent receptor [Bacteroidetes bacterium]|jgi:iron complex outermembrane recepter protein|nr:TonB-dependent receptor [Bacteroidota bacterium]MBT5529274.1 TonB-dependent receptor [Cytophagia bacterium]MBT3423787.1 TonB-dependent receptor [Bacteroidota bacterium]MBT3932709.1 TonB-dependent receptor [Bacteroidota bacterium]MBT4340338.1 TonB-dependent receptor [Bacteroidota bacterium]